jgi:hypothetical protein
MTAPDLDYDDDYDDDDWWDDRPPKEEPECWGCNDSGWMRPGRLARLVGRQHRRCAGCNPGRLTIWSDRLGAWRVRMLIRRLRHPLARAGFDDEPPF